MPSGFGFSFVLVVMSSFNFNLSVCFELGLDKCNEAIQS